MKKIIGLALCCFSAFAQHQHSQGPGAEKPVALYPGLGIWKHPIATRDPQAQKFFDQGMVLLYGFNRYEAKRSFRKALELDPQAAMAQWGVSMAIGPYMNMEMDPDVQLKDSCQAAQAGLAFQGLTSVDRAWLTAAASRCPDYSDPQKYVTAMRVLAAQFPDDPDAQTWLAESLMLLSRWRWYSSDGKPADGIEEAERILQGVLRRYPDHPGANHFYIHAVESSPTPERGVPSAQRLMGIVPAAGHIVHMPAHIWLVLGEYQTAVDVNERAAQVDREYFARTGVTGSYYAYYLHNLDFILYARTMQGRSVEAGKAMAEIRKASLPMASLMPDMAGLFDMVVILSQLRLYQRNEILAMERPKTEDPMVQWSWRFARALALAARERESEGAAEQREFEKIRKTADRNLPMGVSKLGDVLDLASVILEARLAPSAAASVDKWRRAVEIQDNLAYDEPPTWYYPVRESLGAALLLSGDAPAAEATFRDGLRRSPKNGRMLFGLLESLKAQKKADAAAWVEREFQTVWKGADIRLTLKDL